MSLSILLVEDDSGFAKHLSRFLEKEGHFVRSAATGEEGVQLFQDTAPDLVLLDLVLPGITGLMSLEQMKKTDEGPVIIVMTAHSSIDTAVEAMRLGAKDYIPKPIDLEALSIKLEQMEQFLGLRSDLSYVLDRGRQGRFEHFVGDCQAMRAVYTKIEEVAKTDNTTVLITGESGTGKELVANAIHSLSQRSNKPLMQIDCTSIPLSLLESELLGHERGAFTSADRMKKGLLELADSGTLLLDEIGDMDLTLQGKFLRVLQERQFRRVGGTRDLRFDVRVIAATNQDLDRMSEEGEFRRDLLFRLKVFQIELPPLRVRNEDILKLAREFVKEYASGFRKEIAGIHPDAEEALLEYSFPGNVRELRNIIEQAVILSKTDLIMRDLLSIQEQGPHSSRASQKEIERSESVPLSLEVLGENPLQKAERELIAQALKKSSGNKTQAAELLGISRFALQRKLEKLALELLEQQKM